MSCYVSTKDARINVRIDPETRRKFAILARMQGATTASLIHMFIVQNVHKAERDNPEIFNRKEDASIDLVMGSGLEEREPVLIPFLKSAPQPKEKPKPQPAIPKKKEHI